MKNLPTFADGDRVQLRNLLQSNNMPKNIFFSGTLILSRRKDYLGKTGVLEKLHQCTTKIKIVKDWFEFVTVIGDRHYKVPVHISEIRHYTAIKQEYPQSSRKKETPVTKWLETL